MSSLDDAIAKLLRSVPARGEAAPSHEAAESDDLLIEVIRLHVRKGVAIAGSASDLRYLLTADGSESETWLNPLSVEKGTTVILYVAAEPTEGARIAVGTELKRIQAVLRETPFGNKYRVFGIPSAHIRDVVNGIIDYRPAIVHFAGHGSDGYLNFERDSGERLPVNAKQFAVLMKAGSRWIECVVLNTCYSKPHARASVKFVNYVIATAKALEDGAALEFSQAFYRSLGSDLDYITAFELASSVLFALGVQELPQLFVGKQ